jgi:hypothetical protein
MIINPLALGVAIFFALLTIAPKRPDFGERFKDYLSVMVGAFLSAIFVVASMMRF